MSEGQLIRRLLKFERNFTQMPNEWHRDRRLSLKARGLLGMLMSYDHGFKVSIKALSQDGHGGVDQIRAAVMELERWGYLIRRPRHRQGRFVGDDWEIADPSGLSDPALFGYVEAGLSVRVGKSNGVATALENPTRTALENPTPIRTLKNTINPGLSSDPGTRARERLERFAPPHESRAQHPCPARRGFMPCSIGPQHVCIDCGQAEVPWAQPDSTTGDDSAAAKPAEAVSASV